LRRHLARQIHTGTLVAVDEDEVAAAEARLARARAREQATGYDAHAALAAYAEVIAAERDVAAAKGEEHAVELRLDIEWDTGAPLPLLISNARGTAVIFYLASVDPKWDGTYVTVVDSASDATEQLGVIEFEGMYDVRFGGLNDEAIAGHPLSGRGLAPYAAHEVINSTWIAEAEQRNSVHPHHVGGWHERMKHFVLCFHDETLECLASSLRTSRVVSSYGDAVRSVAASLIEP
jgi:hypothetical protein